MSKGLGRIEFAILDALTDPEAGSGYWSRDFLLSAVIDLGARRRDGYQPTRSERETFNRAVRSLIRKGLADRLAYPSCLVATPEGYALWNRLAAPADTSPG